MNSNHHGDSNISLNANDLTLTETNYFAFDNQVNEVPLDSKAAITWLAVASFEIEQHKPLSNYKNDNINKTVHNIRIENSKNPVNNEYQKLAVRKLFFNLLFEWLAKQQFYYLAPSSINLLITKGLSLNQSSYPYRLLPTNYYVCFSHSANKVACAIHKFKPIGIDLEETQVPLPVAKRFYTKSEIKWLVSLDQSSRKQGLNLLWMLKEALIKNKATVTPTLMAGLKISVLQPAQKLVQQDFMEQPNHLLLRKSGSKNSKERLSNQTILVYREFTNQKYSLDYLYLPENNLVAIW